MSDLKEIKIESKEACCSTEIAEGSCCTPSSNGSGCCSDTSVACC